MNIIFSKENIDKANLLDTAKSIDKMTGEELYLMCILSANDVEKFKYYAELSAKKNNSNGMSCLGVYYQNIEKNYNKAVEYYEMAIKLDNSDAMNNLGYYYCIIEKNYKKAVEYYVTVIKHGFVEAKKNLLNINQFKLIYDELMKQDVKFPEFNAKYYILLNKIRIYGVVEDCNVCSDKCLTVPLDCCHKICLNCWNNIDKCLECQNPIIKP